jgi:hypothetical protein
MLPAAFRPDADFAKGRPEPFGYWRASFYVETTGTKAVFTTTFGPQK